jgi:hypothetical protein
VRFAFSIQTAQSKGSFRLITPKFYSRSHDAAIRVHDESGNVIERSPTHRRFQRMVNFARIAPDFAVKRMSNVSAFFRLSPGEQPG